MFLWLQDSSKERAGKPNLEVRIQHAINFYNKYSGRTYSYTPTDSVMYSGDTGTSNGISGTSGTTSTGSTGGLGILATIQQAFGKIGEIFTGSTASTTATDISSGEIGSTAQYNSIPITTTAGNGLAKKFIEVAQSQLGTIEQGNNITPYGKFTGTDGQAWCAAFVSWCMNQALGGNANKLKSALRGGKSAAVGTLWDQFRNAGAMSSTPQPGDIVIYKNNTSHTGIVESVNGNNITTIEGNTSGGNGFERNGGMVARKSFDYTKKKELTGFGRPNWDGANSAAGSGLMVNNVRKNPLLTPIKTRSVAGSVVPIKVQSNKYGGASGIGIDNTIAVLLKTIVTMVEVIAKNTKDISNIYEVLLKISSTVISDAGQRERTNEAIATLAANSANNSKDTSIEDSLSGLKATLDSILAS